MAKDELVRAKQVMSLLIQNRVALTQKGIATKMGYNHSVVSQVLNGKVRMSEKFMRTLCSLDPRLNYEWLLNGSGEMLLSEPRVVVEPVNVTRRLTGREHVARLRERAVAKRRHSIESKKVSLTQIHTLESSIKNLEMQLSGLRLELTTLQQSVGSSRRRSGAKGIVRPKK